jgi:Holliday junction resolvase RusA-like endonuclease
MNEVISITISGPPTAWAAPFFTGKRGISPRFREKAKAVWEINQQYDSSIIEGPVHLSITFRMPIPSSFSKKKKIQILKGEILHTKKSDCSNLFKFAEDCLKGTVIKDDSQVVSLQAKKEYHENPETIITVILLQDSYAPQERHEP